MGQKKEKLFSLICTQRYYHFVAFKFINNYDLHKYWKDCGNTTSHHHFENDEMRIEYCHVIVDDKYYNGQKEDFSVNLDKVKPYRYDLFAIHIKTLNIYVFGYPFQALGRTIFEKFIKSHYDVGKVVKVNLTELIKQNNLNKEEGTYLAKFSGVEIKLTNDANITSVNLDGDKPLESAIYTTFFKDQLEQPEAGCSVEKCSVRFGLIGSGISVNNANIHLDLFGNYKMYMHSTSNTIYNLPYFFEMLNNFRTLKAVDSVANPISRIKNE